MRRWSEEDWVEWRAERVGMVLLDGGSEADAKRLVGTWEAIERLRLKMEAAGRVKEDVKLAQQLDMFGNAWTGAG